MKIHWPMNKDEDKFIADWVAARIQECSFTEGMYTGAAVVDDKGNIKAAVVYHDYRHPNIEMSIAADSPYWAKKEIIIGLLSYPFYQLGCTRVTGLVNKANKRARKMDEHIGFKLEGVHPECGPNGSTIMSYGLLKKDFERKYGQAHTPSSNAA